MAADEFDALLTKFPEHPRVAEATFFRGEALVQLGQPALAEPCFSEAAPPLARQPAGSAGHVSPRRGGLSGRSRSSGPRGACSSSSSNFPTTPATPTHWFIWPRRCWPKEMPRRARRLFKPVACHLSARAAGGRVPLGFGKGGRNARQHRRRPADFRDLAGDARPAGRRSAVSAGECWKMGPATTRRRSRRCRRWSSGPATKRPIPVLVDKAATAQGWALYKLQRYAEAEQLPGGGRRS